MSTEYHRTLMAIVLGYGIAYGTTLPFHKINSVFEKKYEKKDQQNRVSEYRQMNQIVYRELNRDVE